MQILHCHGNHWISASSLGCKKGETCVFNSLYTNTAEATEKIIRKIFGDSDILILLPCFRNKDVCRNVVCLP